MDESISVREAAVEVLGKSSDAMAHHHEAIARLLQHEGHDVRQAAVETLGKSPDAVAQHGEAIVQLLL